MRTTTALLGSVFLVAAASTTASALGASIAAAEPAAHQVHYTLTAAGSGDFNVYYATAAPANLDAYRADPTAFVKSAKVNLGPDSSWTMDATLADGQWAFLSASGAQHYGQGDPNVKCQITVDGQPVAEQTGAFTTQCQLRSWN